MTPIRFALLTALCLGGCRTHPPDAETPSSRPGRSVAEKWAPEKRPWGTVKDPSPMPYDPSQDRERAAARKSEPQQEQERKSSLRIDGLQTGSLQPVKSDARRKPAAPVVDLGVEEGAERKPPAAE